MDIGIIITQDDDENWSTEDIQWFSDIQTAYAYLVELMFEDELGEL